jgi:hypothetical protein
LLIPAAVGWLKSKKQISRLNSFHQQMALVYGDGKVDENDTYKLDELNKNVSDSYSAGKISNDQYTNLKTEVSAAYQKFFKKKIESFSDPNMETVNKIRNEIEDAYNTGKLISEHYTDLKNEISTAYQKIFKIRIQSNTEDVNKIKNDIDAYSDRKITELDYNLLNSKISRMLDKK